MTRFLLIIALAVLTCLPAQAQKPDFDYGSFKQIPILHEGRIKPLDSFVRIKLKRLTGHESYRGQPPIAWLARTLFDPASEQDKILRIKNPALKKQLGLPADQDMFSAQELRPGLSKTAELMVKLLQKPDDELTDQQRALLDIHDKVSLLHDLSRSLSLIAPLNLTIPEKISAETPEPYATWLALKPLQTKLVEELKSVIARKGKDPENYNAYEKQISLLSFQLEQIRADGMTTRQLRIMPVAWSKAGDDKEWLSPWQLIAQGQGSPQSAEYLELWQDIYDSWRQNDAEGWQRATAAALSHIEPYAPDTMGLELFYYDIQPYNLAMGLYGLTILFCIAAFLYQSGYSKIRPARFWPQATLGLALLALSTGIVLRMIILGRPPVSTLYESSLFVTAIATLFGLLMASKQGSTIIAMITALLGLALLFLSPILITDGESMGMLTAVLNTNFWLATHVVIITMGYGVSILTACLAHIVLGVRAFAPDKEREKTMLSNTYKTALGALFLTALGTVLGGIWADQSWGRFWGWDPKENGALLIVLWLIWVLHGRMSGKLRPITFAALAGALNIVVALTWFGVNLLGVGLHSYGFTSGLAAGLFAFCSVQFLVILTLYILARKQTKQKG